MKNTVKNHAEVLKQLSFGLREQILQSDLSESKKTKMLQEAGLAYHSIGTAFVEWSKAYNEIGFISKEFGK